MSAPAENPLPPAPAPDSGFAEEAAAFERAPRRYAESRFETPVLEEGPNQEEGPGQSAASYIRLKEYSGPLDMLLQLIRRQEMDIFQIDIHKITRQYVEHIKKIPEPDLEGAGDFIRMAALLMYIKSKTLLQEEDPDSASEENAPALKQNLIRLLANYQKFQTAGRLFYGRSLLGRDVWASAGISFEEAGPPGASPDLSSRPGRPESQDLLVGREKSPFPLIQSCSRLMARQKGRRPHRPAPPLPSLIDRAREMASALVKGAKIKFSRLIKVRKSPYSALLTFLSLLELCRLGFVSLRQKAPFADLDVNMKKTFDSKSFSLLNKGGESGGRENLAAGGERP